MISMDPSNPFPHLSPASIPYASAQAHARQVDAYLGLRAHEIEAKLATPGPGPWPAPPGQQPWIGLGVDALQTPYTELRWMLELLRPSAGQTLVDLGAGYGRIAFVLARHFEGVRFIGYELIEERVAEGNLRLKQHGCRSALLQMVDLSAQSFTPASADYYFIYDFGTRDAIAKCLDDLRHIARHRQITVIGRGRASRDSIEREEPWLSQVIPPEHHGHFSIYRSA